jgi:O-antigen/teichoic acid export membrane protein
MAQTLKKLAGETVIYGASTMVGRLLNWLLMPFYIRTLSTYEFGVVINFYAILSVLLVVLTYGLETGFFRFSGKTKDQNSVYKTLLFTLFITSSSFLLLGIGSYIPLSNFFYNGNHSLSILLLFVIVSFDAFLALPFARLRLDNRPIRFGVIKLANIGFNIFFNVIFLLLIPYGVQNHWFSNGIIELYNRFDGVFYVFFSNALSSVLTFFFFVADFFRLKGHLSRSIIKPVLLYSFPVLLVGISGMVTQNIDKIILPVLLDSNGFEKLAVYGANFKIGVLMSLFTQSFRFAFEPFFFKSQDKGKNTYVRIMDYFVFFGLIIFLGVTLFIDAINIVLTAEYLEGNSIIPLILLGQFFYGIYFNLSLWYKLTDKTWFGALFGFIGTGITVGLNFILIPIMGINGAAVSLVAGYFVMMVLSWWFGQKFYPVSYRVGRSFIFFLLALVVYFVDKWVVIENLFFSTIFKGFIFALFIGSFFVLNRLNKSFDD